MQLQSDRITSILNSAIKWGVSSYFIYKVVHGGKGEKKEAVPALPMVSRALSSVSVQLWPYNEYCYIKYNDSL